MGSLFGILPYNLELQQHKKSYRQSWYFGEMPTAWKNAKTGGKLDYRSETSNDSKEIWSVTSEGIGELSDGWSSSQIAYLIAKMVASVLVVLADGNNWASRNKLPMHSKAPFSPYPKLFARLPHMRVNEFRSSVHPACPCRPRLPKLVYQ